MYLCMPMHVLIISERRGQLVLTLLHRIREIPGSNLGPETGYPD
jgi:hypothetical protein